MTSARYRFDYYQSEFLEQEVMNYEYYEKLAIEQLRKYHIFPPVKENPGNFIVLLQGLPVVKPEKLKSLMQKIALSMVKYVTETFKRDYMMLNPYGGSCLLRFVEQQEAKKFMQLFNGSKDIFGINYPLSVQLFSGVYKQLAAPPPVQREASSVDLSESQSHLTSDQVASRFVLQNGNSYYFCSFNNCLGLKKGDETIYDKLSFSKKGTFVISEKQENILLETAELQLAFPIDLGQYDQFSYNLSPCERFLAVMYFREQNDKMLYKAIIYSIFEKYAVFTSDELGSFGSIPLSSQVGFSSEGKHMYMLNSLDDDLCLFSISYETFEISRAGHLVVPALKQIEFSPTGNLLGLFLQKVNVPSYFLLIDPQRSGTDPRIFTRNLHITEASFSFAEAGEYVSVIAETVYRQETSTMVVYVQIAANFPVKTIKLRPKSKLSAIAVLKNGIVYSHGGKIYRADEKIQEQMLLPFSCNTLHYSEITGVLVCVDAGQKDSRGMFKAKVVLLDYQKALPIVSFDGAFYSIQPDYYKRYLFVLTDGYFVVYAISGYYIFKDNFSGNGIVLRPENAYELVITGEMQHLIEKSGKQYIEDYLTMYRGENTSRDTSEEVKQLNFINNFRKAFLSDSEVQQQQESRAERIRRIRLCYPYYLQEIPIDIKYEIKFKVGMSEASRITKEYYEIIMRNNAK